MRARETGEDDDDDARASSNREDDDDDERATTSSARRFATWAKRACATGAACVLALYVVGLAAPEETRAARAAREDEGAGGREAATPTSSRIDYVPQAPRAGRR